MNAVTLHWQRLDEPGVDRVELVFGIGLALTACGRLQHEVSGTRLSYRMSIDRQGWLSRAEFDIASPVAARLALRRRTDGRWLVDGEERPEFDNCDELDLQCGALTNAFPIRRLAMAEGERHAFSVLSLRLPELTLEICPQSYTRLPDQKGCARYQYHSPDYSAEISVDARGFTEHRSDFLRRVTNNGSSLEFMAIEQRCLLNS